MDYQTVIKAPISAELADFIEMFNRSLDHEDGMLAQAIYASAAASACDPFSSC